MRLLPAALAAVLLLTSAACGYVAGVQPPLANIPNQVAGLDAIQRGSNLIVHFAVPTMTSEGIPIRGTLDFDLRAGIPPDPWNEGQWESSAQRFQPASVENGIASYTIPAAAFAGKDVVIAARTSGENHKPSVWSKYLALPVVAPLAQPAELKFALEPKGIRLSWSAAGEHFRVLRREGDDPTFKVLAETAKPEYFDATAVLGHSYAYQMITYAPIAGNREAQSDLSDVLPVVFRDVFPPAAPAGLRASVATASIELSWESNDEPDLASYRIYRSTDGGAFEKIGDAALPAYSDKTAQAGHTYNYAVTAMDQAGNESNRSAAASATLR